MNKHIEAVNAEVRKQNPDLSESESVGEANSDEVEWEGIEDGEAEIAQDEEEYVDEDRYTTVTVEAMGDPREEMEADSEPRTMAADSNAGAKAPKNQIRSKDNKAKQKKRKFRYESKAERQITRQKARSKNHTAKIRRQAK